MAIFAAILWGLATWAGAVLLAHEYRFALGGAEAFSGLLLLFLGGICAAAAGWYAK